MTVTNFLHDSSADLRSFSVERNGDWQVVFSGGGAHVVQRLLVILDSHQRQQHPVLLSHEHCWFVS